MKTVLILGSKPGASIPRADHVYCANAAIGFYEQEIKNIRERTNVVSGGQLSKHLRFRNEEGADHFEEKYKMILHGHATKLVICQPRDGFDVKPPLFEDGYPSRIEVLTPRQRQLLTLEISGMREPIKPRQFSSLALHQMLRYAREKLKSLMDQARNREYKCKGPFRPSIGIFSLIYAIKENGHDSEYVISGIGLSNRDEYKSGNLKTKRKTTPHTLADEALLDVLSKEYRISTQEEELRHVVESTPTKE